MVEPFPSFITTDELGKIIGVSRQAAVGMGSGLAFCPAIGKKQAPTHILQIPKIDNLL